MASRQAQLADAVAADLNQDPQPWTLPAGASELGAVRTWRATWTRTELGVKADGTNTALKCAVTPGPAEYERVTRNTVRASFATDMIFCKAVDPAENTEVDAVASLAEEIAEWFASTYARADLAVGGSAAKLARAPEFVGPSEAAIDSKLLSEERVALIVVRLTWHM